MRIETADDEAAIAALDERFGLEATVSEGAVTFYVPTAREFVPRLFAELGVADPLGQRLAPDARRRVHVASPAATIRDAEESPTKHATA